MWGTGEKIGSVIICLQLAGCTDGGPALLACRVAAGAFKMLLYYNDVAPVSEKQTGLTAVI